MRQLIRLVRYVLPFLLQLLPGVVLLAAVGFLEIFLAGSAVNSENLVIVAFFGLGRHPRNSRLRRRRK